MKITIALLTLLLIGVSVWFFIDHTALTKKNDAQVVTITKMQSGNANQATIIKNILSCANTTENTYNKTKTYVSVSACIKSKLNI